MNINIAICDDNPADIDNIKSFLNRYEMEYDIDFSIELFSDGTKLLEDYKKGRYHLIFLDVEMPGINGLDIARFIRNTQLDYDTKIVFVSNYPEYMQDSFNVQAFNYFPKPFLYDSFVMLMEQLINTITSSTYTRIVVKGGSSEELVNVNDIVMITSKDSKNKRLSVIFPEKEMVINGVISEWYEDLLSLGFISPSRGNMVNIRYIHYINDSSLVLKNGMSIPISRRHAKEVRNVFNKRLLTIDGNR